MQSLPALPSERRFGAFFCAVCAGFGLYGLYAGWNAFAVGAWLAAGAAFAVAAIAAPRLMRPLNVAWFHLGNALGRIVSPIVLGVIFYGLLTPVAWVGRLFGRDELRLRRRAVDSYWIERTPPGPAADSFRNQF